MNMSKKKIRFHTQKEIEMGKTFLQLPQKEIEMGKTFLQLLELKLMKFGCTPSKGKCICQKLTCRNWNTGLRRKTLLQNASQE